MALHLASLAINKYLHIKTRLFYISLSQETKTINILFADGLETCYRKVFALKLDIGYLTFVDSWTLKRI